MYNEQHFLFYSFTQDMSALAFPVDKNIHVYDINLPLLSVSCNLVMPEDFFLDALGILEDLMFGDIVST